MPDDTPQIRTKTARGRNAATEVGQWRYTAGQDTEQLSNWLVAVKSFQLAQNFKKFAFVML